MYQSRSTQKFCNSPPDIKRLNKDDGILPTALRSAPKSLYIQDAFRHSYSTGPSFVLQPRNSICPSYTDYAWGGDLFSALSFVCIFRKLFHKANSRKASVAEYILCIHVQDCTDCIHVYKLNLTSTTLNLEDMICWRTWTRTSIQPLNWNRSVFIYHKINNKESC